MRLILLTAGTGSFYCGTCVRDNALVNALRALGHDALLVPLYLPPVLDEPSTVEGAPLFYGGINVYLQQKSGVFRRTPRWVEGWLDSPRLLHAAAARAGMTSARDLGEITLSVLRGEEGRQAKELERLITWLRTSPPDVVCLSNGLLVGLARRIREATGATLVCTLQGEDTYLDSLPENEREAAWRVFGERAAEIDVLLPVSRYYAGLLRERIGLSGTKVRVVYPGILLDGYELSLAAPDPPVLGYLARMNPLKGLDTLVEAYLILRSRNRVPGLRLRVAGTRTAADVPFVERLQARLEAAGAAGDAQFLPNLDRHEKLAFLRGLAVFSVPATYGESFGLYLIEAMAAGIPVVQPECAAFPEILEATGGGLLCAPGDPAALADGLEELLLAPERARAMGARARQVVRERFSVDRMAGEFLAALAGSATTE